jgi:hypothetical protein
VTLPAGEDLTDGTSDAVSGLGAAHFLEERVVVGFPVTDVGSNGCVDCSLLEVLRGRRAPNPAGVFLARTPGDDVLAALRTARVKAPYRRGKLTAIASLLSFAALRGLRAGLRNERNAR